jgi:hypothetical protein
MSGSSASTTPPGITISKGCLTAANVPRLKKPRIPVDEKIDVSPLVATPAIWNVTPGGGAGGGCRVPGLRFDGDDICLATGNGMDPGTTPQSLLKLRYTAGVADVNNGKPTLALID